MIKIISGSLKGLYIKTSKNIPYRPMTATLRKSFFDYLNNYIKNKVFLDAFAGTGIMGFEAYSRGASYIIFIDTNKHAISLLNINIKNLQLKNTVVIHDRIENIFYKKLLTIKSDIIFLDPPFRYPKSKLEKLLNKIIESSILKNDTIINIHYPKIYGKLNYNSLKIELIKEFKNPESYLDILMVK